MTYPSARIAVVGTTSWGTTLAVLPARQGHRVSLWARTPEEAQALESARENMRLLPGIPFPPSLRVTWSLEEAFQEAELVVVAVPSNTMRANIKQVGASFSAQSVVLSATKGLEAASGLRMSQVMEEELPASFRERLCVLSGPNLAPEIALGRPASTVIAARSEEVASRVQWILMSDLFRIYTNTDVTGVELAGALKNIVALGAGICDGLDYGDNAKAAFLTRGLGEITRLGVAAGAHPLTFAGLAGMGDLIATCASPLSRNRHVGEQLARGRPLEEVLASMQNVAEGVDTIRAAVKMARDRAVEMPIAEATHRVLFEGLDPRQAVTELMGRPPRAEWSGVSITPPS